jgi:hypothetical protein
MAEAQKTIKRVERTVVDEVPVVLLKLDQAEAETLVTVLGKIGGPPHGERGNADSIYEALKGAGVRWRFGTDEPSALGHITFN